MTDLPTSEDVRAAAARIAPWIRRTPTIAVTGPGARPVVLKLDTLQRSGSFKLRGALNKLMRLGRDARDGVITASGGNHGLGVAWAGFLLGVPVQVCVPATTPAAKREALEATAAEVQIVEGGYPEADRTARNRAQREGLHYVHAYDDADVIAGQGTAILELIEDAPEVRTIVVAVGGGGLAAGATLAAEGRRVIGVEPYGAATMYDALRAGQPVRLAAIESVAADSLGAGQAGALTFAVCRAGLDRVELVEDAALLEAQRWLWHHARLVVEPGAGAGIAALAAGLLDGDPGPIGVILCGANTDPRKLPL
ncbi:MAG: pyridoxal-phosphate dependent enzyme [Myxococcales bacterium]|nr:pyridoxal-phosphate dependent enzyme [Myxococcales bacterium]